MKPDTETSQTPLLVVVTAARDEAGRIGPTIDAMRAQTRRPLRWVIVDDGSTDGTAREARDHADGAPWIIVVERAARSPADFASKVRAFRRGCEELGELDYDLLANLDADVTFEPDYFERLVDEFVRRPTLGVAGGRIVVEVDGERHDHRSSANSVSGAVQCFRRACYEEAGGFLLLKRGGEDAAIQITARSHGWEVDTRDELVVIHHGPVTNRRQCLTAAFWSRGIVNRGLRYDPLFQVVSSTYRMAERPWVLGGLAFLAGYIWATIGRVAPVLPCETVRFLRAEQHRRLRRLIRIGWRGG